MIVDLGTGDGRAALAAATAQPDALVLAMDADAASMGEGSRRAALPTSRGGLPNLVFVVAAAEAPPPELYGAAGHVRILFPWASLLRGVLGRDRSVAEGIVALLAPGGTVAALVSVAGRDRLADLPPLDASSLSDVAERLLAHGLTLTAAGRVSEDEVRATRSTWGRKLVAGDVDRPVWRLEMARTGGGEVLLEGQSQVAGV